MRSIIVEAVKHFNSASSLKKSNTQVEVLQPQDIKQIQQRNA